jgi:hypothetical protein
MVFGYFFVLVYVALFVYLIILANRLVRAVEKIGDKLEKISLR